MFEKVSKSNIFGWTTLIFAVAFGWLWFSEWRLQLAQADELASVAMITNWPIDAEAGRSGAL